MREEFGVVGLWGWRLGQRGPRRESVKKLTMSQEMSDSTRRSSSSWVVVRNTSIQSSCVCLNEE